MNKENIRQGILVQLQADYDIAVLSANTAHEDATNEESKAENKYDTRGLEASYLAEGQSRRVAELETEIAAYEKLVLNEFSNDSPIRQSALVTLEDSDEHRLCLFIGPHSGGMKVKFKEGGCLVVTPKAPLGNALMGKRVGDEVSLSIASKSIFYDIIDDC